jgi:hypothetical protein
MTSEQFVYWLQGFSEISQQPPNESQWKAIQDHLSTVFHKVTPIYPATPMNPGLSLGPNWLTQQQVPPVMITC